MKFILGKKIDMTQVWRGDNLIAVTRVEAGPCIITQVKSKEKDGYLAVQVGYGNKKEKRMKKPQKGHLKNIGNLRILREFRVKSGDESENKDLKLGSRIDIKTFAPGDIVKITGVSKGKGFQGVVKRHGFHGQDKTHGNKDQLRMPGSIGAGGPQHVFKGRRMPGRMGGDKVSTKNLEIIEVDDKNNFLLIKGAVPGARNSLVMIMGEGELKIAEQGIENKEQEAEEKEEEVMKIVEAPTAEEAKSETTKTEEEKEEIKN